LRCCLRGVGGTSSSALRSFSIAWVLGADGKSVVARECSYVHGLYQTFDEILVNAADNVQRNKGGCGLLSCILGSLLTVPRCAGRTKMTCIRVDIDAKANSISVYNDGARHSRRNRAFDLTPV
jgi:hypothetical protein